MKKILSLDGGAVRAVIQGRVLAEIERRTGAPLATLFDLFAGTSSGGNLAIGLVTPDAQGKRARNVPDHDFYLRDVVLATTAAPTFFGPARITNVSQSGTFYFVDGGVFANNPAMLALVEARLLFPDESDFLLVSLGSGSLTHHIKCEEVKRWGVVQWARPLLNVVFDGVADAVGYQLERLLPMMGGRNGYYRFQTTLTEATGAFDDASDENFAASERLGEALVKDNEEQLGLICTELVRR
jgi:predicted acylesterase/phospholipase RssA